MSWFEKKKNKVLWRPFPNELFDTWFSHKYHKYENILDWFQGSFQREYNKVQLNGKRYNLYKPYHTHYNE